MVGVIAVVALIVATGIFVASEFAFVAVDRDRIDEEASKGSKRAQATSAVLRRLSFHLSALQLGITVTSVLLGFVAEPTIAPWFKPAIEHLGFIPDESQKEVAITFSLIAATTTSMLLGELVPKNFAIALPHQTALWLGWIIRGYGIAFGPLVSLLNGAANWIVRHLGIEPKEELASVRTLEELELVVRSAGEEGVLEPESVTRLRKTFRFSDRNVADVVVPRGNVIALPTDATIKDLSDKANETGYSRFPIYEQDLDGVVGVAHVKDIYGIPTQQRADTSVTEIMHELKAIPETVALSVALEQMRQGVHLAIAVDEYGGTSGIVTLDDLLSDLVGNIHDEHDLPAPRRVFDPTLSNSIELDGSTHVDDIEEELGIRFPEGPYDTVAGFVLAKLGHIPQIGEKVEEQGWTLEVTLRDGLRIANIKFIPPSLAGEDNQ